MELAVTAAGSIPTMASAATAIGPVGWVFLGIAAVAVLGYVAYRAGAFDYLKDKLDELGNAIQNGLEKVVEKAKSIWQEIDIPGKIEGVKDWCNEHILLSKKKTGSQPVEQPKDADTEKNEEDKTAEELLNTKKGSVKKKFPKEWLDKTLEEITKAAKGKNKSAQTARKLLKDNGFGKGSNSTRSKKGQ